jgi:hypothetical protein
MNNIYIPPNCTTLDKSISRQQIRLGIQGYPGTGKTWAALTFPNPIVLNLDRGLGAHTGRSDVVEIPFYKQQFSGGTSVELKDKLVAWLYKEAIKLTAEQTLVFDGCTSLQNAYHLWFAANQHSFLTKGGKVDDFAEWQVKKKYFGEIMELFKGLSCNVIFIAHEAARPDKPTTMGQPGEYSGKIRPLLTGAFGDEIVGYYTDWFRQHAADKPIDFAAIKPEALAAWKMTREEFKAMCDSFPRNTIYYFQTEADNLFDGKASSLVDFPRFIPANYESFNKYQRKITV